MKAKAVLFSTPMVKAVLAGKKTQTRRIVKPQPVYEYPLEVIGEWFWTEKNTDDDMMSWWPSYDKGLKSKYKPGDILWVRETWRKISFGFPFYEYKADGHGESVVPWRPSIHMPRAAARIFLEVKNVRCERLQDISEDDADAEGFTDNHCSACGSCSGSDCYDPISDFKYLWDSLNARRGYSWESNPWVWVYEFVRVEE